MPLLFDCRACGARHPSRLRVGDPHLLQTVMQAFGEVLEPCPTTGRWMPIRVDDLCWGTIPAAGTFQTTAGSV
jgi:hypothetical protein